MHRTTRKTKMKNQSNGSPDDDDEYAKVKWHALKKIKGQFGKWTKAK